MRLLWALVVPTAAAVLLAGCADRLDSRTREDTERTQPSGVAAAQLFEQAPLAVGRGGFSGDGVAAWYTDFTFLARYDIAGRRWSTQRLPTGGGALGGVGWVPRGDGTAAVLVATCEQTCEDEVPAEVRAFHATDDALEPLDGPVITTTAAISTREHTTSGAHFLLRENSGTRVVTVTDTAFEVTDTGHDLSTSCFGDDGVIGVAVDREGGDPLGDRWVVAGAAPDELRRLDVPDGVVDLLGDVTASQVCVGGTLAVVGPDGGWELTGEGDVLEVRSRVAVPLGRNQLQNGPAVTHDGVTWIAATGVNLRRDDTGWHSAEVESGSMTAVRDAGYAVIDGVLVAYPPRD